VPHVSSLDIAHFKEVVGHYVTGVTVITASSEDGPAGFTCQSFESLSLEPMLVSFAAKTLGRSWPKVSRAGTLGINILSSAQEALARAFATSDVDKFAGVRWSEGRNGAPLLDGALAHLEGRIVSRTTHGDHDLVVVAVDYAVTHQGAPLTYYRGGFGTFA
jgi:3-hydroxy-9,10-secoandrosta-1,3,5(10)-triene-9,17-dione monooxygenase reductase component